MPAAVGAAATPEAKPARDASWMPIVVLASAQFVMVLDSSVMNVSILTVLLSGGRRSKASGRRW